MDLKEVISNAGFVIVEPPKRKFTTGGLSMFELWCRATEKNNRIWLLEEAKNGVKLIQTQEYPSEYQKKEMICNSYYYHIWHDDKHEVTMNYQEAYKMFKDMT